MKLKLPGFCCFYLEGIFFYEGDILMCQGEEEKENVYFCLESLIDTKISFFMCHKPPIPVQHNKWGLGSCYWEPVGHCPAGHHNLPSILLRMIKTGILKKEGEWYLDTGPEKVEIPLKMMEGHSGVLTGVTELPEKLKGLEYSSLEQGQMALLLAFLEKLKAFK